MKKGLRFSEKEEDRCEGVEEEEGEEDGSLDRLLLVQSDLSSLVHQVITLSLSLLTICLFFKKMISNNKDCILLCVFYNLDEKFSLSLFHSAFSSLIGFVLESLSLSLSVSVSAFVFVWLLGKCGRLYLCFWILSFKLKEKFIECISNYRLNSVVVVGTWIL